MVWFGPTPPSRLHPLPDRCGGEGGGGDEGERGGLGESVSGLVDDFEEVCRRCYQGVPRLSPAASSPSSSLPSPHPSPLFPLSPKQLSILLTHTSHSAQAASTQVSITSRHFQSKSGAWFAISNVLYQHKKLAVHKALQLFDSLIKPIFLYAAEFWLPFIITKKGFESQSNMLKFWEHFQPELLNQKVCRLLLSVHKRCSRLAVLGELGRYPVFIPALKHCLKYQFQINNINNDSLISVTLSDMKNNPQIDCWLSCVEKIKHCLV